MSRLLPLTAQEHANIVIIQRDISPGAEAGDDRKNSNARGPLRGGLPEGWTLAHRIRLARGTRAERDHRLPGAGRNGKLSSFGSFVVRKKGQRIGRNPKTGKEVPISPRRVMVFKPSAILKQRINGHDSRRRARIRFAFAFQFTFASSTALNPSHWE